MKQVVILAIGEELTRGELVDSNSAWISERLTLAGFQITAHLCVRDNKEDIAMALQHAWQVSDIVISTGGLGPTSDDVTAESVAYALSRDLVRHTPTIAKIKNIFVARGRKWLETNAKQADIPSNAQILSNAIGTAPGFAVFEGEKMAAFMPGVPREMKAMFDDQCWPLLQEFADPTSAQVMLRIFGLPESLVAAKVADLESETIKIGYRVSFPEIEVKFLAKAENARQAKRLASATALEARSRLHPFVFGEKEDSFAASLGRLLRNKNLTFALAESCTGGRASSMLTAVPGSSNYFVLGAVTYANTSKMKVLGVAADTLRLHGAVSAETVEEMAIGAAKVADADLAAAITGIAGPGGGTDKKPVGTVWFALADQQNVLFRKKVQIPWSREMIQVYAAYTALDLARRHLLGVEYESDGGMKS